MASIHALTEFGAKFDVGEWWGSGISDFGMGLGGCWRREDFGDGAVVWSGGRCVPGSEVGPGVMGLDVGGTWGAEEGRVRSAGRI